MLKKSAVILTLVIIALFANTENAVALYYYGGSGDGFGTASGDTVIISSAADQTFTVGDPATAISTITITGQTGGGINTVDDLRVKIPASFNMTWDTTDLSASIGGSASGKVSATVSYPDSKTLLINVTTNFASGDNLTVDGLSFKNFTSTGFDNLELSIDGGTTIAATDDKRKTISLSASSATFTGGNGDGFTAAASASTTSTISISSPASGKTVGQTPTIIGTAGAQETVLIKDKDGTTVGSTTADANGNFRITLSTTLATDTNSLTPYVGSTAGSGVNMTVVASPSTDQTPTVTSPGESATVRGNTPTITGKGLAGSTVTMTAKDANGNLPLTDVATTTVDGAGDYTITSVDYTTSLVKGTNYLTITVNGVTSGIREVSLTDPFGIIFDSTSNNPVKGAGITLYYDNDAGPGRSWIQAVPGTHIAATNSNPQTTGSDGAYNFLTINGDFYTAVTASGYTYPSAKTSFPSGRTIVTGSKGEVFTVAGVVIEMDHPMDPGNTLLRITKDANKKETVIGDVITYTVTIQDEISTDVTNVYLEDKIPAGLKYISGKAILDNAPTPDPAGNRPITFNIGTVSAGQTRTLKYQLVVGSGVTLGNYENIAFATYSDGTVISNKATETVKVVPDPLFDSGTIIGKVFLDKNENGIQDQGEAPIPNVHIATEEGTIIITDKDGKYHLPAVIPGRHLLRLDERTLPEDAYLTTDKAVVADITPGLLVKVNFGVNSKGREQMPVRITQGREKPDPRLNVAVHESAANQYEFRIFTNYSLFVKKWKLEIQDKDIKTLVKNFEGTGLTINDPIYWDGKDKNGKPIRGKGNYVYLLTVTGKDGLQDVTKERKLKVTSVEERKKTEEEERQKWLERESKTSNLEKQNIRIEGETISVHVPSPAVHVVRVIRDKKLEGEIRVAPPQGITPYSVLESQQSLKNPKPAVTTDIILPKGEYDIEVVPQGTTSKKNPASGIRLPAAGPTGIYSRRIKVGEDYLFFVAMADTKAGYTLNRGDIEPVQHDDKFKKGFWSEGKLAYYLKGKIKGKYLVTSSLDTGRDKKELFRNLDQDKYYSVYGDASVANYDAANTQGTLYLLIERDKSSAVWGNYNTAFTDTEFAVFNRTLYGGKLYYESVSSTPSGEPKTKLIVFRARAQQRAAHNEFAGTGGSLYYLKNKDVVEGSEKIKIEVKDKITGLVLSTKEIKSGAEYEIDYSNGRIVFWEPVSRIADSDSIISSSLLGGNPVYVVVDYEYEMKDKYDQSARGGRIQQSLTDYLRIGGTYVEEAQLDKNYELKGTDATLRLGKNIKFTGEFAQSESEEAGSFISADGGLSFTELATGDLDKGKAYGLKAEAHLFDKLGLTSYYKQVEKGFSSTSTASTQGKELAGAGATLDITPETRLKVSHDIQKLIDGGNLQAQLQTGAQKTETSTAQITREMKRLKLTGEYRHQRVTDKLEQFESEANKEENTVAAKADYKWTEKVDVSLEQQATLKSASDHQTTAGIEARVSEKLSLRAKETVGTQGTATSIGATANIKDRFQVSSDLTRQNDKSGRSADTASLSGAAKTDEKTEVHTTLAVTDASGGGQTQSVVLGSKRKINDYLTLATDRTYAKSAETLSQANTYSLAGEKDKRKLEGAFTKQRSQSSTEVSNTNIFGLSGDINDKWATRGSFERGVVQYHSGAQAARNAGSIDLGVVDQDKDTGEIKFKASGKLELRLDDGDVDKRQYLAYNALEGKINSDTTIFAKANLSQTRNTTTGSTEAQYKELAGGIAYRPVHFDRINLLAKYTYLEDDSPSSQSDFSDTGEEKSHTLAGEVVYDLTDQWQLVEKLACKTGEQKVSGFDFTKTLTWLMVHRLNYNIDKDWQIGAEYRRLAQQQAKDSRQGVLIEAARKIGDFIQVGAGYNFTGFNDDLTHLDYTAQGPFVRLTAKFYDRTPEEIERARQRRLEGMIKLRAQELVNDELARPDSPIMQELGKYFYLAEAAQKEKRLGESQSYYVKILQTGKMMYSEAEEYIRGRIELERRLKEYNTLASDYHKEGKLQAAKDQWAKILKEADPKPIYMRAAR